MPWLAVYVADISVLSSFVSLHLYLKVHSGKLEAVKGAFARPLAAKRRNLTT